MEEIITITSWVQRWLLGHWTYLGSLKMNLGDPLKVFEKDTTEERYRFVSILLN